MSNLNRFFLVEPKSCFHAGDFVARRGAIASICAFSIRAHCPTIVRTGLVIGARRGCEFILLSQVRFSRRRRCRTQKCGQLDLSSTRACWLVICQVWLSRVARRQMRAVRVMRLGMRTYRISCMDVTDSICRRAAYSVHIVQIQVNRAGRKCAEDERSESEGRREARRSRPQGPAQIESVALCVWQCHLRNVSTLSNLTLIDHGD